MPKLKKTGNVKQGGGKNFPEEPFSIGRSGDEWTSSDRGSGPSWSGGGSKRKVPSKSKSKSKSPAKEY